MTAPQKIDWYFDFISPFAWLQWHVLKAEQRQRPTFQINCHPILFAGLLKQHGHKGPAEIAAKRRITYRYCHWYAKQQGIPFAMPAAHPFNPLPFLRLAISHQCDHDVITRLFEHIWVNSADNADFHTLQNLAALRGFEDAAIRCADQVVKDKLKANTEQAIAHGLFGVPSICVDDALFWGVDMTAMALDYLDNPEQQSGDEYRRLDQLPVAKARA